jgi:hypothetical protein
LSHSELKPGSLRPSVVRDDKQMRSRNTQAKRRKHPRRGRISHLNPSRIKNRSLRPSVVRDDKQTRSSSRSTQAKRREHPRTRGIPVCHPERSSLPSCFCFVILSAAKDLAPAFPGGEGSRFLLHSESIPRSFLATLLRMTIRKRPQDYLTKNSPSFPPTPAKKQRKYLPVGPPFGVE